MAGFDEAKFRQMAKEANYSDDEVESYIASQKKNAVTGKEFGEASTEKVNAEAQALRDAGSPVPGTETPAEQPSTLQKFFDWVKTPAGTAAAGAAGIGVSELARRKMQAQKPVAETPKIEPTFTQPTVQQTPAAFAPQPTFPQATTQQPALPQGYGQQTMNVPTGAPAVPPTAGAGPQPVAPAAPVDPIQAAKIREAEAKAAIAEHKLQQLQAGPKTTPAAKVGKAPVSEAELQMIQKSGAAGTAKELQAMEAANKIAPTPDPIQTTATPVEKQAAVDVVKQQELKTGTGKPAIPGAAEPTTRFKSMYGSAAEVPKTHAFVRGAQYIDVLRNDLGQPTYTEQFSKREFPQTYLESVEAGKNINRELNRPTREQLKAQGAALPEPTEGITQKAAGKKLVKVGGVAGALIALSDLAKAETTKEREQAIGNALLGLLPPGMDVGEAGAPTLSREQRAKQEEIALLGSPFYNTQAAKNIRQAKKVGAGRGIAPPSAYQR